MKKITERQRTEKGKEQAKYKDLRYQKGICCCDSSRNYRFGEQDDR